MPKAGAPRRGAPRYAPMPDQPPPRDLRKLPPPPPVANRSKATAAEKYAVLAYMAEHDLTAREAVVKLDWPKGDRSKINKWLARDAREQGLHTAGRPPATTAADEEQLADILAEEEKAGTYRDMGELRLLVARTAKRSLRKRKAKDVALYRDVSDADVVLRSAGARHAATERVAAVWCARFAGWLTVCVLALLATCQGGAA